MKPAISSLFLAVSAAFFWSAAVRADDVEGVARFVGSSVQSKLILEPADKSPYLTVCRGDIAKRIGRLSGMTFRVSGAWQLDKDGSKRCLEASSFVVTKMTNGRDAVVGVLSDKGGQFQVTSDDGKANMLADAPDGLKKLVGKKVILDLRTIESPSATRESASKVVSYAEFP